MGDATILVRQGPGPHAAQGALVLGAAGAFAGNGHHARRERVSVPRAVFFSHTGGLVTVENVTVLKTCLPKESK